MLAKENSYYILICSVNLLIAICLKLIVCFAEKNITENNHVLSEVSVQSGKAAEPRESGSQSLLGCLFSVQCRMDSVIQYMK